MDNSTPNRGEAQSFAQQLAARQPAAASAYPTSPANEFRRLWDLGYRRLCPIVPPGAPLSERSSLFKRIQKNPKADARGKTPGVKWPDGTWSGFDFVSCESKEADLDNWHAMGAGVGIKTGPQPDGTWLIGVDADTSDESSAKIIAEQVAKECGDLPTRIGRPPKALYVARIAEPLIYTRFEFGHRDGRGRLLDRLELLAEGRQFVAHGIHPGTMQPYRWTRELRPYASLPLLAVGVLP